MVQPQIVDNFLPPEEFKLIEDIFLYDSGHVWFPWYFASHVGARDTTGESDGFYFMHNFYDEETRLVSSYIHWKN